MDWTPSGHALVVGDAEELLGLVSSRPGRVIRYDLRSGERRTLFWSPGIAAANLGIGYTSLSVVGQDRILLDEEIFRQTLFELSGSPEPLPRTRGSVRDRQPAYSPDGRRLIFSSNRSGNLDLWVLERETGELRQLTDDPADDWDPDFTPDGRHILWSSSRSGHLEIWMAEADGSRARQVTHDGLDAENPTSAGDGEWIVYSSGHPDKRGIWKIHPDGTGAARIAKGAFNVPEVSPDGRYVVFFQRESLGARIFVIETDSGDPCRFEIPIPTRGSTINLALGRARWTPDGHTVALSAIFGTRTITLAEGVSLDD